MITEVMTVASARELVAFEEPGLEPERVACDVPAELAQGEAVLVDLERAAGRARVRFVRRLAPAHATDVARFRAALEAFARCGIADLVAEPIEPVLAGALARLTAREARPPFAPRRPWDPRAFLCERFLQRAADRDEIFPMMWWHDDPSVGVDEMATLLARHGASAAFPTEMLVAQGQELLDRTDDEDAARDALCARLCAIGNELLAAAGAPRRLCGPYFGDHDGGEPNWLVIDERQYAALRREGLLRPWEAALRTPLAPTPYRRPPDRGEIDLDEFPSGDDPF